MRALVVIVLIMCVLLASTRATLVTNLATHLVTPLLMVGGGVPQKYLSVSDSRPPLLVVDTANMYPGWYMEKHKREVPYAGDQAKLIDRYLECMAAHYAQFLSINGSSAGIGTAARVAYVIKNHQSTNAADVIAPPQWVEMEQFTASRPRASILVAEDYAKHKAAAWRDPKNHYLRGRDDYLLFEVARREKRAYGRAVIMTNDKFDDFERMGLVPPFSATVVENGRRMMPPEQIRPRPNALGQIKDYAITRHNINFNMQIDPAGQIAPPDGKVWSAAA